uniref:Uncharacterized protein n=1 Tax=Siphoviridae sp. ctB3v5 TaxID=2826186 RepID=A0A8S5M8Z8_9CAUD|nr:MAG TPA: hypothetical protein [Siphoviridae sp. ctB3v5]
MILQQLSSYNQVMVHQHLQTINQTTHYKKNSILF